MTLKPAGYDSSELSFTIWALGWSLEHCICAAVLLGITIAKFDRRLGRAANGGRRSAPIRALPVGAAPVTAQYQFPIVRAITDSMPVGSRNSVGAEMVSALNASRMVAPEPMKMDLSER
jgi:hypothetical protein